MSERHANPGGNQNEIEAMPEQDEAYTPPGFDPVVHRALYQSWVGRFAAVAVFGSLIATIGAIIALAMLGRKAEYIQGISQSVQPFLLPAIGAIVGYAVGTERLRREGGD